MSKKKKKQKKNPFDVPFGEDVTLNLTPTELRELANWLEEGGEDTCLSVQDENGKHVTIRYPYEDVPA